MSAMSVSRSTPALAAALFTRATASASGTAADARPESPTFAAMAAILPGRAAPMNATRSPSFTPVMLTASTCGSPPLVVKGFRNIRLQMI